MKKHVIITMLIIFITIVSIWAITFIVQNRNSENVNDTDNFPLFYLQMEFEYPPKQYIDDLWSLYYKELNSKETLIYVFDGTYHIDGNVYINNSGSGYYIVENAHSIFGKREYRKLTLEELEDIFPE